jgi:DNA polymerase-3 subunit delta'
MSDLFGDLVSEDAPPPREPSIENFFGNATAVRTLTRMIVEKRIPQTILLHGAEGVGKATLARRFAAAVLGEPEKIELDDQSLEANRELIAEREKLPAEKRNEDPLLFSSHPDFLTFPPDGPLRQLSIPQMRLFKERAQYKPLKGAKRVFLLDHIDRANEQAANSLLKTLEEPPEHLITVMTAENAYDLLPTIRSRAVHFPLVPLSPDEMAAFLKTRPDVDRMEKRLALACGSPGLALSLDIESFDKRRLAMLTLLKVGARQAPFGQWARFSEGLSASKSEKLDHYLKVLYVLLEDLLRLTQGAAVAQNTDIAAELVPLARAVSFAWLQQAVKLTDELVAAVRRNVQKSLALDALAMKLQGVR